MSLGYTTHMIGKTDSEIFLIEPTFGIGDIVVHTLYHFRAVVVDVDSHFDDSAFSFYDTQDIHIDRNQPWYKLLIDDGDDLSYAPEILLCADTSVEPITHPMLQNYLVANPEQGRYISTNIPH